MSGFLSIIFCANKEMSSLTVPSITSQSNDVHEYSFTPARKHHGESDECIYLELRVVKTIFLIEIPPKRIYEHSIALFIFFCK